MVAALADIDPDEHLHQLIVFDHHRSRSLVATSACTTAMSVGSHVTNDLTKAGRTPNQRSLTTNRTR